MFSESDLPPGAVKVGSRDVIDDTGARVVDTYYMLPGEERTERRTVVRDAPKVKGIGPVDSKTGMPTGFRSVSEARLRPLIGVYISAKFLI